MKKFVAVLIFLTLFIAGAFAYTLTIQVFDAYDLAPVPGINAFRSLPVGGPWGPSNASGTIQIPNFTTGTYYLLDPTGCYSEWLPVSITFGEPYMDITAPFYGIPCPPNPVELSSFTAMLTSQYFVNLTWVSQSETAMLGYNVYRSETSSETDAIMITESLIPAANTSTTQTYSIQDTEVEVGHTYYYWLESVDMGSSQFHGPVSVLVEGEVPPVLPQVTSMKSAYPNPFKESTSIEVSVKEGENGSVTIYNILGQVVRSINVEQGIHNIQWDGLNGKGEKCGSGIYFYKLSTPSVNQTKKMVIVK